SVNTFAIVSTMAKQNIAKAINPIPKVLFEGAFRPLFTDVQLDCCKNCHQTLLSMSAGAQYTCKQQCCYGWHYLKIMFCSLQGF
ncbi:MAG: hypothetical protein ACKVLN_13465, partial [Rhodobacterales bacterium]